MSFVQTLKQEDLNLLREAVKRVHFKHFDKKYGANFVTTAMLDQIIEWYGPEVVEKSMKFLSDKGIK